MKRTAVLIRLLLLAAVAVPASAQDDSAELAKKLSNPVAALISVPLQLNYDMDIGAADGDRWVLNVQPVIPFTLNEKWNLISRTILPINTQDEVFPDAGRQTGIGDVVQSFFFSPKAPTGGGWIWGVGPVFQLPTGSDDLLTSDKWSAGPTIVVLKQMGPWTVGALGNHLWSFAGDDERAEISATFLQPFLSYATPTAWTFGLNTESLYDWNGEQWTVPLNVSVSKVTKLGSQLVSVGGGLRYWAEAPDGGPEGLEYRFVFALLYPK
jgi:Putative MetA-pathway of phenol degradation